jgi:iron(III) transport system permease protein
MPKAQTAFTNSMMLGVGTAVIVMLLTTITAWVAVRSKARGRAVLDVLTVLPLTVPGLVLGLALAFLFLRVPLPIYGTLWILLISYCTQYIPYGQRYASASISQISTELEESAVMSGVSWWTTLRRVVFPLAAKGILAGWIYVFMLSFRELSSSVLLYSPGGEVMSVLIFERYNAGDLTTVAAIGVLMMLMMAGMAGLMYGRLGARLGVGES